jgi:uncharacterized membrane protein
MHMNELYYLPLTPEYFLILAGFFLVAVLLLATLRHAYLSLGVSSGAALVLLLASLVGSYFNIPVAQLPPEHVLSDQVQEYSGIYYVIPRVTDWGGTVIAINVGGALIPTLMSIYLLITHNLWLRGAIATAIVAVLLHLLATPVHGVGIAVPIFWPAVITAIVSLVLAPYDAAPLAYIAGGMGTLIGADLTNLSQVRGLGAPVASIGGAGTFDGVFLTGILAVLLASLYHPRRHAMQSP